MITGERKEGSKEETGIGRGMGRGGGDRIVGRMKR